ncbi:hypothetical protein Ndes2526B_g05142 [Nannochloris sp. 'desiccata']
MAKTRGRPSQASQHTDTITTVVPLVTGAQTPAAPTNELAKAIGKEIQLFPDPPLPISLRRELPTTTEVEQLDCLVQRAELRSLSDAFIALGKCQALINLLDSDEHPLTVLQEAISAQLSIAIPVVQEAMRALIVSGTYGPTISKTLQVIRLPNWYKR